MTKKEAHIIALRRDEDFSRELVRVYGKKFASAMRYRPSSHHVDTKLIAALEAKIAADEAWRGMP